MAMIVTCRVCKQEFAPNKADIMSGNWHTCWECRDRKRWSRPARNPPPAKSSGESVNVSVERNDE